MTKTLLDCGNCGPDFNTIRAMAESDFGACVLQTHGLEDTLAALRDPLALCPFGGLVAQADPYSALV